MGKTRNTGKLATQIQFDNSNNLVIGNSVSSSFNTSGSVNATGGITGSIFGIGNPTSFSASISSNLGIINNFTASNGNTSLNSFSASNGNDSLNAATSSYSKLSGGNTFSGTQIISGSTYVQGDLVVYGSSSIQYISASFVSIGTNIVQLNTNQPAVRYAGLSVQDSGSAVGVTGSMFWDGCCNRWIYSNPSGVGYSGGVLMSGPRGSTLGSEPTLTCNYIAKSGGSDHLYDSVIYESGSCVGIGTTTPIYQLEVANSTAGASFRVYDSSVNEDFVIVKAGSGNFGYSEVAIKGQSYSIGTYSNPQASGYTGSLGIVYPAQSTGIMSNQSLVLGSKCVERMRILSVGTVAIGTQTSSPQPHAGGIVGGLIVQGLNSCRGIIEIWDGTCGKGVFQQIGGTTYIGNLDKGTSGGSLRLLVNGSGTSATEAMVITCSGRVLINNSAQNGCADYSRLTISGGYAKTNNCTGFLTSVLHLATCENDFPFGAKFGIYGDSCSTNRYLAIQTGDHNITNQGNIVLQPAGGNVGIGTATACSILDVRGTITNGSTAGSNSTIDVSPAKQSIANGGYVDFPNMSGMIVVNDWTDGSATIFLVGAGVTSTGGSNNGTAGTTHYSVGISGYRWCNNKGYTANFGFLVFKTRNTA